MRMKTRGLLIFLIVAVALPGPAQLGQRRQGTDALTAVIKEVQRICSISSGVSYLGGGSDRGDQALLDGRQQVAPMARALRPARTCQAAAPHEAEGLLLALDGVAVVTDVDTRQACGGAGVVGGASIAVSELNGVPGLQCPACAAASTSCRTGPTACASSTRACTTTPAGICSSRTATATYGRPWPAGGTRCSEGVPGGPLRRIRHLFRPGDRSKTGALFLELLGLPPAPSTAFCNGAGAGPFAHPAPADHPLTDFLDRDPVRRACLPTDQVCSRDGTLGLVLVAEVPTSIAAAQIYPSTPCHPASSACFLPASTFEPGLPLPQRPAHAVPEVLPAGAAGRCHARCRLPGARLPHPGPAGQRHRPRRRLQPVRQAVERHLPHRWRRTHSHGRLLPAAHHQRGPGGATPCTRTTSSEQIRCLAQASPCSVGITGFDGAPDPGAAAAPVAGIQPTIANIRRLITSPADPAAYPLGSRLLLNTMVASMRPSRRRSPPWPAAWPANRW